MGSGFYTYLRRISVVFCSFLLRSKVPVFEERTKKERRSNGAEGFWRGEGVLFWRDVMLGVFGWGRICFFCVCTRSGILTDGLVGAHG